MAPVPRILMSTVTAVSALLCITTCALWAMSYPFGDEPFCLTAPGWAIVFSSFKGDLGVTMYADSDRARNIQFSANWDELDDGSQSIRRTGHVLFIGAADEVIRDRAGAPITRRRAIFLPHWLIVVVTAVPSLVRRIRGHRPCHSASPGHCPVCGYDLRATPDRCPEVRRTTLRRRLI